MNLKFGSDADVMADLYRRTKEAIRTLVTRIRETGEPLEHNAIVDEVESNLPTVYPSIDLGVNMTRRRLIKDIANDILEFIEGGDAA